MVHSIACDLKAELCEMVRQAEGDEGLKGTIFMWALVI